jgi:DNA-directed RNA polymerase subunit omega
MKVEELTAKILKNNPNLDNYKLAMAVAKRSDQLLDGAKTKLNVNQKVMKPADIALMEFAEGLLIIKDFGNEGH